jgi:hypothetical protein
MRDSQIPGPQVTAAAAKADTVQHPDQRQAWQRPVLRRLSADLAESGLLLGGEIIILLHHS